MKFRMPITAAILGLTITFAFSQNGGNVIYHGQQAADLRNPATVTLRNAPDVQISNNNVMEFEVNGLYNAKADGQLAIFNVMQLVPRQAPPFLFVQ